MDLAEQQCINIVPSWAVGIINIELTRVKTEPFIKTLMKMVIPIKFHLEAKQFLKTNTVESKYIWFFLTPFGSYNRMIDYSDSCISFSACTTNHMSKCYKLQKTTERQHSVQVKGTQHTNAHLAKDLLLYLGGDGHSLLQPEQDTDTVNCTYMSRPSHATSPQKVPSNFPHFNARTEIWMWPKTTESCGIEMPS
jgi:hypothetical protein